MEENNKKEITDEVQPAPSVPAPEKKPVSKGIAAAFGVMGTAIVGLTAALIITNLPDNVPEVQESTAVTTTTAETADSVSETETQKAITVTEQRSGTEQ